jgi:hypothetical protein
MVQADLPLLTFRMVGASRQRIGEIRERTSNPQNVINLQIPFSVHRKGVNKNGRAWLKHFGGLTGSIG